MEGLTDAAVCRALGDFWIGINMTKALTGISTRAGRYTKTPAGRVQTPTLMMFGERLEQIATSGAALGGSARAAPADLVLEQPTRYVCVNATGGSPTCGFAPRKLWCSRAITTVETEQLLTNGRTELLEGFRSKKDRPFKATITVGPEGKPTFEFAN